MSESSDLAEVSLLNANALLSTLREFNLTLPRNAAAWRACARKKGAITGIAESLTILCTDGCVAWFQLGDSSDVLYGHIQHFDGEVRPPFSATKPASPKGKKQPSKKKSALQRAIDLLNSL